MKNSAYLSVFMGTMFAIPAFIITKNIYGAIAAGSLTALFLMIYLIIYKKIIEKRYLKFEQQIISPIIFKTNGNFDTGKGVRNANIYLCAESLIFITVDQKPYGMTEIPRNQVIRCDCEIDKYKLVLMLNDELVYVIQTPEQEELIIQLNQNGWIY